MKLLRSLVSADLDPFLGPEWHDLFQLAPIVVYDLGASESLFSPYHRDASVRLRFFGFEPDREEFLKLAEKYRGRDYIELRPVALCDTDGPVTFFRCPDAPSLSSLFDRDGYGRRSEAVKIEGVRLDSVPRRFTFPAADFVKMDTEGNEFAILRSGPDMLSSDILGVWTEIAFWRGPGEQGCLFHDIDKLMVQAGFVLFDLQINRGQHSGVGGKKGKLRSGDALYLCDFAAFHTRNRDRIDDAAMRIKLVKLVSLCVATGYLDYAIETLDFGRGQGLVEEHEISSLLDRLAAMTDMATIIPGFPGRLNLALFCDMLSSMLHRDAKKGIPPSFNRIGNHWPFTVRRRRPPDVVRLTNALFGSDASGHKIIKLHESGPDESQ